MLNTEYIFISTADTFRLAAYYSDHMVLQMAPGKAVVWGYGDVGAQITVLFKDIKYPAVAATSKSLLGLASVLPEHVQEETVITVFYRPIHVQYRS